MDSLEQMRAEEEEKEKREERNNMIPVCVCLCDCVIVCDLPDMVRKGSSLSAHRNSTSQSIKNKQKGPLLSNNVADSDAIMWAKKQNARRRLPSRKCRGLQDCKIVELDKKTCAIFSD